MPISFMRDSIYSDISAQSLRDALTGKVNKIETIPHPLNQTGRATGKLSVGNLSLLYAAGGTRVENVIKRGGWVLLIEELGEYM